MSDDDFLEDVAREYVVIHGVEAAPRLRELAEIADAAGDQLSAEAWRDIADAVQRLLGA